LVRQRANTILAYTIAECAARFIKNLQKFFGRTFATQAAPVAFESDEAPVFGVFAHVSLGIAQAAFSGVLE
jgi:hypothetical protein